MPSISSDISDQSIHHHVKRKRESPAFELDEVQMKLESNILRPTTNNIDQSRPILTPRHSRVQSQKKLRIDISPPSHAANPSHHHNHSYASPLPTPGENDNYTQHTSRANAFDLTPCYICHRKPTRKSDLDSFADCESCGNRICYICIRQCEGPFLGAQANHRRADGRDSMWRTANDAYSTTTTQQFWQQEGRERAAALHLPVPDRWSDELVSPRTTAPVPVGHRKMICSRCCVERGQDGEVWCLGCLMASEDL